MYQWLDNIPLIWAKIITAAGYVSMIVWAWFRPKGFILKGAPNNRTWRDLRIWASVFMGMQIFLYLFF